MNIPYYPKYYYQTAIGAFTATMVMVLLAFQLRAIPLLFAVFAVIEVTSFFFFLHVFSKNWQHVSEKLFRKKVFRFSLFIRIIWVVFSYFFFQYQTGQPFAFGAADSLMYHEAAKSVLFHGFNNLDSALWGLDLSDRGYPVYLAVLYFLFGDHVLIPRLINAFLGVFTVLLIYNIARRNFGEQVGRIAAIMAMLLPNLIYYAGLHLKETLMVFLIVAFIERVDYILRSRKNVIANLIIIFLLGGSLFFIRTVLGFSAIFALFSALILSKHLGINWLNRVFIGSWFLILIWFFLAARIEGEINFYIQDQDQQEVNMQFRAAREEGNRLATYGSTLVFLPFMFVAPFPTFVNIEIQQQQMLLSGGYFVRNIYAFFVILALFYLFRKKLLRKHILILSFVLSYLFILAKSSFAISERFHMPVVPFLLILAAYGITQINVKNKKLYIPYLVLIVIVILGWNWFKLAGRGAI